MAKTTATAHAPLTAERIDTTRDAVAAKSENVRLAIYGSRSEYPLISSLRRR
jgi:hypothetical protein